jgi:hypothetical protein
MMLRALFIGLLAALPALPAAAQMQSFTAPQYAALRDTAAKVEPLRRQCIGAVKSAKHYWNQADSLHRELQEQRVANAQLRDCFSREIDRSRQAEAQVQRLTRKRGAAPSYYTRPAR